LSEEGEREEPEKEKDEKPGLLVLSMFQASAAAQ
jgi:hypothetical protein